MHISVHLHNNTDGCLLQSVKNDKLTFCQYGVYCIHKNKIPLETIRNEEDRMVEDSLENTFSCVPKVQGSKAESLRQTDRDARIFCAEQSFLGLFFLF